MRQTSQLLLSYQKLHLDHGLTLIDATGDETMHSAPKELLTRRQHQYLQHRPLPAALEVL